MLTLLMCLSVLVVVVFVWLLSNFVQLRLVIVQEATAVAFKYLGRFTCCEMEFTGHHFDPNGSIVLNNPALPDELRPNNTGSCWCIWRVGGWIFYIWPFVEPAKYSDYNDPDGFGEGIYVRLGDVITEPVIAIQKTKKPENVGLKVKFVSTMSVVNPYLYLFLAPRDVKRQAINREDGVLRAWIENHTQDHVQEAKGNGTVLWSELITLGHIPVFDEIEDRWGLKVLRDNIVVREVDYADDDYRVALEATGKAKLLAKAEVAKIGAIDQAMDQWVKGEAKKMKKPITDALTTLKADGSWQRHREIYMTQILADADASLLLVGNPDGTPIKGDLAPAIALFAAATFGRKGGGQGNRGKNPGNSPTAGKTPFQPSTEPQKKAAEEFFAKYGVYPAWGPEPNGRPIGDGTKPKK